MKIIFYGTIALLIFFIFRNWFIAPFVTAGDFPYFFRETIAQWAITPPVWDSTQNNGLGGEQLLYALNIYVYFLGEFFVNMIGLPWEIVYKIFIFGLFILLSVCSTIYFVKKVFGKRGILQISIAPLLFVSNTYILMVVGGGQMGVALAYSLTPLVLARFIMLIRDLNRSKLTFSSLIVGLVLAFQIMFDLRIAFITMCAVALYIIYYYFFINKFSIKVIFGNLVVIGFLVLGLHVYWILPIILSGSPVLEDLTKNGEEALRSSFEFFSFAQFSQTFSFLHSNWPENIFGKVYFMRPEFLVLPILAFSSLLFIKKNNQIIIFFALLGLIGAFLAKGANPPFEEINIWIFMHMPAAEIFRDSTKFYLFIALAYTILIPFSVNSIYNFFKAKFNAPNKKVYILNYIPSAFLFFVFCFLFFLLRPVFLNELRGTFRQYEMPKEYMKLKDFLIKERTFFRTLWIPTQHRFNFYSLTHPAISAKELFTATNSAEIIMQLHDEKTKDRLVNLGIQYIIVPYDSFGEIFVKDRRYDDEQYQSVVNGLNSISWLEKVNGFGKVIVYKTSFAKEHFWIEGNNNLTYTQIRPSQYTLRVSIDKDSFLIFTDAYSPFWMVDVDGKHVKSNKTKYNTNSFFLDKKGTYTLRVYFSKEKYYEYGKIITLFFAGGLLLITIYYRKKQV